MNNKNDSFDVQIECIENMDKNKVIIYTHPVNEKFIEIMLDIVDKVLNINREEKE